MKKIFLLSLMLGVAPAALAEYRMTPREAIYYWASQGNIKNLKALQKSGYSLDMPDAHGKQAICEAVEKKDITAFKTLEKAKANMNVFCLYNLSQEERYAFNQAYYGLPLILPVMTDEMLNEEIAVQPIFVEKVAKTEPLPEMTKSVQYTEESYTEPEEISSSHQEDYSDNPTESIVFKPYIAANLFYGREKAKVEAHDLEKKSSHISGGIPGLALAFGTKISNFRAELAVQGHTKLSEKIFDGYAKGKTQTYAGLLNAYYDIPTGTKLTPYFGAGVGLARNKGILSDDVVKYSNSNWSFAWQLGAGVNYTLTDNLVADLGYRYTDYGKVNVIDENGIKYKVDNIRMHNLTLGLRYEM